MVPWSVRLAWSIGILFAAYVTLRLAGDNWGTSVLWAGVLSLVGLVSPKLMAVGIVFSSWLLTRLHF